MKLRNKVALITGAGRNIGKAIATAIAREGGRVIINTRKNRENLNAVEEEISAMGAKVLPVIADVSIPAQVDAMIRTVENAFGPVDILINNAVQRMDCPFLDTTFEQWQQTITVNLNCLFNCTQAVLPGMIEKKWGRIINFSGISANIGIGSKAGISTVKAGIVGFTKSLAREFGPSGITVNAISPGDFQVIRDPDYKSEVSLRKLAHTVELTALQRVGKVEEIASLCAYLGTEEAGYITGQTINVNGGAYM